MNYRRNLYIVTFKEHILWDGYGYDMLRGQRTLHRYVIIIFKAFKTYSETAKFPGELIVSMLMTEVSPLLNWTVS